MEKRGVVLTLLLISLGCIGPGTENSPVSTAGVKEDVEIAPGPPGYYSQATYESDCAKRPDGSICLSFSDDYLWLVHDTILSRETSDLKGEKVEVGIGINSAYYHIVDTDFVKEVKALQAEINIEDDAFQPETVVIKKGSTVIWKNLDEIAHAVASNDFSSNVLATGSNFKWTFNTEGTFDYLCSIHPYMTGKIMVE